MKGRHLCPSSATKERTNPSAQAACLAAVKGGALERVSVLLREGAAVNWQDEAGVSLLFHSIFRRHFAVAEEILARGANIDLADERGWTPLFWAAFNDHADIVGFLVAHHADTNAATHEGDRPLFMAAYKGYAEVVRLLLAGGAQWNALDSGGPRCAVGGRHERPRRDRETAESQSGSARRAAARHALRSCTSI